MKNITHKKLPLPMNLFGLIFDKYLKEISETKGAKWMKLGNVRLSFISIRFEATLGLFCDGPRNFEPRQMTKTTPELSPLHQASTPHQREDVGPFYVCFSVKLAQNTTYLQWNRLRTSKPLTPRPTLYH
ncbi:hypothetical protein AVEN_105390-1 [Araneus ventricosus]|uniref:Uncharacterized protein n=1 Tax=Araneus ventricosus TaxID=182803 RepID=A0A4Y2RR33_ARAVE|nr:hypothetical protein AVEN_170005-1 [Araneus ventricosus]GBN78121.1 hypothetical protein AVEN_105390-1 [Araneus ventricosus]